MKTSAVGTMVVGGIILIAHSAPDKPSSPPAKTGLETYLAKHDTSTPANLTPFLEKCLSDFRSIKVGMTRGEIEKKFPLAGGISGVSPVRFTLPQCPFFIIEVTFDFKRNPADQNRAIESKDDRATSISRPYLENPAWD